MFIQTNKPQKKPLLKVLMVCGLLLGLIGTIPAESISLPSAGVNRFVTIEVDYTIHEWWLLSWKDSEIVCQVYTCLLYTSPSPRDRTRSRMPSSA